MADKLLGARGGELVGKHQAKRFVTRLEELKIAFNRAKDRQRILQEDPQVISAQFKLITDTKAQYDVYNDDVHNFNKTSFQIGIISLIKVIIGLERRTQPNLIQLGNREWIIVIQSICATRYATLLFIIYKRCVHISAQYKEIDILYNQKLLVSKNGQINNALSLKWLKHFNAQIKAR